MSLSGFIYFCLVVESECFFCRVGLAGEAPSCCGSGSAMAGFCCPQLHLCAEFLSAGLLCQPLSFQGQLVALGKPSLALRSQEKLLLGSSSSSGWSQSRCRRARGSGMLSLKSISGVLVLGDACTSDSTACEQAESICVHCASKGRGKNRVPVQEEQCWGSSTSIAPHQKLLMLP